MQNAASHTTEIAPVVFVKDGIATTNSRDVAAVFDRQHKDVLRAIDNLGCSPDFNERNFAPVDYEDIKGERRRSFDMTKDGFTFLVMGFTGERAAKFKEAYIARFNAMEQATRGRPAIDINEMLLKPELLRGALLAFTERVMTLEGQMAEAQPKLQALDRIADTEGSFCITDAAKTLQVRPKDLFSFLRSHGWIYGRLNNGQEVAYQSKLVAGLLEHKTTTVHRTDGSEKTVTQVRVTTKGLTRLAQELPSAARLL